MENFENAPEANELQEKLEKRNTYLEYGLFIVLGFLLGIVIKTEASKRITMGYNDYQINAKSSYYDLNALQKSLSEKAVQDSGNQEEQGSGQENISGASTAR